MNIQQLVQMSDAEFDKIVSQRNEYKLNNPDLNAQATAKRLLVQLTNDGDDLIVGKDGIPRWQFGSMQDESVLGANHRKVLEMYNPNLSLAGILTFNLLSKQLEFIGDILESARVLCNQILMPIMSNDKEQSVFECVIDDYHYEIYRVDTSCSVRQSKSPISRDALLFLNVCAEILTTNLTEVEDVDND